MNTGQTSQAPSIPAQRPPGKQRLPTAKEPVAPVRGVFTCIPTAGPSSQIVCSGCRTLLMYPQVSELLHGAAAAAPSR